MNLTKISIGLFAIFLVISFGFMPISTPDYIAWSEQRPLKWYDFKAKVPANTGHSALTNSGISLDLSAMNGEYSIEIIAQFDKSKSWKKKDMQSEELLRHEQLHFDITEVYARKLRKKIMTSPWKSGKEFESVINDLYASNQQELYEVQDLYDTESEHSQAKEKQKEWEDNIADSLSVYSRFRGQNLTLKLKN